MEILTSIAESLNIDWRVVIAQFIAFAILLFLLIRYMYRPVESILQQRREQIANSLSGAEQQREQAESLRKEYEDHLAQIADESRVKLEQAMKDAEAARQRMLASVQLEIQEMHERGRSQLALERDQLRQELRSEMSEIAVMAAAKALRSQVTPAIQAAVVDNVIRELDTPSGPSVA